MFVLILEITFLCTRFINTVDTTTAGVDECLHYDDYCSQSDVCTHVLTSGRSETGACPSADRVLTDANQTIHLFGVVSERLRVAHRRSGRIYEGEERILGMIHKLNQENQERRQDIRSLESRLGDYQTNLLPMLTERLRLLDNRVRNESLVCGGSEWYYFRQKCYYFSRLLAALSWSEAQLFCKRFGGKLAIIRDEETNDFLTETIGNRRVHVWIGLRGADADASWKWVDKTSIDYNNWRYGEPTDHRSLEKCACLTDGWWEDFDCSDSNYFICENNANIP